MYFDGSLNLEGAGAGVLLISPMGEQLKYVLQIFWKVSNNEAEYEALLHGLRLAASLGIKRLLVYGDSAVVINQVNKSWDRNKENMDAYCLEVRKLENKFYGLEFFNLPPVVDIDSLGCCTLAHNRIVPLLQQIDPAILGEGTQAHRQYLHFPHLIEPHWIEWLRRFACFSQRILQ
jgi:hypothetical protein